MKIWCFDDTQNWGQQLAIAAQARGHHAIIFNDANKPTDGYVFFHMHHHPSVRMYHKRAMQVMSLNPDLILIPDYRSSVLHDDKIEQARQLSRWMPRTRIMYTPNAARRFLDTGPKYPFFSKTAEGASSHNVRLLKTTDEANNEVRRAFSDLGIKCRYAQEQRGYLLWQESVDDNDHDLRIIAVGRRRLVLRRGNRDDRPMASGSGRLTPIKVATAGDDILAALKFADEFFRAENMLWCGVDIVRDTSRHYVLETTASWTMHGYYECEFFGDEQGRTGEKVWEVLLDEIEAGVFD